MRILFVHGGSAFGGGEKYIIEIAEALLKKGCQVYVLYCNEDIPLQMRQELTRLGAGLIYEEFNVLRPDSRLFNCRFSKLITTIGPHVIIFNRAGGAGWSKFSDLITTAWIRRVPRLVDVEHGHPCAFPKYRGRPFYTLRKRIHCWLQAHCLDAIVCMNSAARDILIKTGYSYPEQRLHTIYNGIDVKTFKFDPLLRETYRNMLGMGSRIMVLYCGRLSHEKGPDVLLEAWGALDREEREEMRLVFVGDGPLIEDLRNSSERLRLGASVQFTGFRKDILGFLCACDISITPSRSESFGLSLAEAMAVGRYAIATKVGGVPELLSDSSMGVLLESDSPQDLANAIRIGAKDSALRERVGRMASEHIMKHFSAERNRSETLTVILGED